MEKVLFFATEREARASIEYLKAVPIDGDSTRFSYLGGTIYCTGIGLIKAGQVSLKAPSEGVEWINIGIAGSLDGTCTIGAQIEIDAIRRLYYDRGRYVEGRHCIRLPSTENAVQRMLFSAAEPIHRCVHTGVRGALVDMEGYAIASIAARRGVPLRVVKFVSDICSEGSSRVIQAHIDELSEKMACCISLLANLPD